MKFSVRNAARKWSCGRSGCDQWPAAVLAAVLLTAYAGPAAAYLPDRAVPLPQPRPAEAPAIPHKPGEQKPAEADRPSDKPAAEAPPAAPASSACRLALTDSIAIAPSIPAITGPGACGGDDLVRLEAVVLPDNKGRVAVKPPATLRCSMASAIADWIRTDMAPLAEARGSRLTDLDNFDSFDCRGRNGVVGAQMSEHGRANALDVRSLKLASGASIALTDRAVPREVRETVLHSVCTRFTTVLGPGSDGSHEDHIHLDLIERHSGYRICQWEVWDPLPVVAPLLPAERPEQAPPREVAGKTDAKPATAPAPLLPVARPEQAPPREVAEKTDTKPAAAPAPLLPAARPEQAPPREVAEKTDAKPATPPAPREASAPPKAATAPKAAERPAAERAKPEADHPKPKSKPKPRRHRHTLPDLFSLFR